MQKKNILVTGCGGAPAINFVRSLQLENEPSINILGIDSHAYKIHRNECDEAFLCPNYSDDNYLPFLLALIKKKNIHFIHAQPEKDVYLIGKNRSKIHQLGCKTFLPRQNTIEILRDKYLSYCLWEKAKITVPKNILINSMEDLKLAFDMFGKNIWIRETIGAAGKGALSRPSIELAKAWIDHRNGWGITVAAKHLQPKTTTWQSIWHNGQLVVGQGRDRLYWEMHDRSQSGVTGITGTGVISNDLRISDLSIQCIKAIDLSPNGIFSVDFTYDENDLPNPTEINIGKFFTTHYFITKAGCNMPKILIELAFNTYRGEYNIINPIKEKFYWIRGVDIEPILVKEKDINRYSGKLSNVVF